MPAAPARASPRASGAQEFDEERTGLISVDTLRTMMTRILPHPMAEEDLDEMLAVAQPGDDGTIAYADFVAKMFEV